MKIISKFRDYYDTIAAIHREPTPVYKRETRYITKYDYAKHIYLSASYAHCDSFVIGFCGQFCQAVKVYLSVYNNYGHYDCYNKICYDAQSVYDFYEKHLSRKKFDSFMEKEVGNSYTDTQARYTYRNFFSYNYKKDTNLFIENHSPIIVYAKYYGKKPNEMIVDDQLSKYEFFRKVDPYQAFQEISMFLGGCLATPTKEIPSIPDDVMAGIKGFNKYSFRKDKMST